MSITILPLNILNGKHLRKSSQVKNTKYHTSISLAIEHMCIYNEVCANKLTLCSELMIFIGYKDNGYRFICHTQGNVIFHSTQAIFDKGHFSRYPSSHSREQMPPSRLIPEIELSAPEPFGINEPASTSFLLTPAHPKLFTPPIPPNLPTHLESPSSSLSLTLPKQSLVKIEEVKDIEMHSLSPSSPEAGLSQYTPPQVPTVIPQK